MVVTDEPDRGGQAIALEGLPHDRLVGWFTTMNLIREFEGVLDALSIAGKIPGGVHCAIGQEAVAVGANTALLAGDVITTAHRPHHHALAKGMEPTAAMAELFGKATGCAGGRGGTMHLADFANGYFPGNGIVGANVGLAMGAALASKLLGDGTVACAFFGDGAANTGRTWESVNMAAVWGLPLVLVCENNLYAVETHIDAVFAGTSIADRASGFGLPSFQVDGQDVGAVHRAVREARARAAAGDGPTFIEALTYRFKGHSTGEEVAYREDAELEAWRSDRDPIENFRLALETAGLLDGEGVAAIRAEAAQIVASAVEAAEAAPTPDPSTAVEGVTSMPVSIPGTLR